MHDSNPKFTPGYKFSLSKDLGGDHCKDSWKYRSIFGIIANSTRPDIAYDVHECARLLYYPKSCHETDVKHISRYLTGTKDKIIILNPDSNMVKLYLSTDADFLASLLLKMPMIL